jgi:hypothetical protein
MKDYFFCRRAILFYRTEELENEKFGIVEYI